MVGARRRTGPPLKSCSMASKSQGRDGPHLYCRWPGMDLRRDGGRRERRIAIAPLSLIAVQSRNLTVAHPVLAQPFNFGRRSTS
jgi:hypothetical protein